MLVVPQVVIGEDTGGKRLSGQVGVAAWLLSLRATTFEKRNDF